MVTICQSARNPALHHQICQQKRKKMITESLKQDAIAAGIPFSLILSHYKAVLVVELAGEGSVTVQAWI